jgi:HAD superfamily hydrolase (TIGR01450 family)
VTLQGTDRPLCELYDVALLDLDGVVYVGPDAVPAAPESLAAARRAGMRLGFVTNNAARPPAAVAAHLVELGIEARPEEVVTSSQAAAHYLSDRLAPAAKVLVIGTTGLTQALTERGLVPVEKFAPDVAAVVQGYSPTLSWAQLAEGAVAIRAGVPWVATNLDPTVPSPRGPLPGNGSLVAALRHATCVEPVATGKPDPTMHRETVERTGAHTPLAVGDRLDTDIEGANAAGCPSLLVLTGVTSPGEALAAPEQLRPTFLARDLAGLLVAHPAPARAGSGWRCGAWTGTFDGSGLALARADGSAPAPASREAGNTITDADLDAWRALCAARWSAGPEGADSVAVSAGDPAAEAAARRLGLTLR